MVIRRSVFFFILLILVTSPFVASKIVWLLRSQKTTGIASFRGKSYTGMYVHDYTNIMFQANGDTVWYSSTDNLFFKPDEQVTVFYQPGNPKDARLNVFADLWGDTLVYGGIPALLLLVIFLHPKILPCRNKVQLLRRKPFVKVV